MKTHHPIPTEKNIYMEELWDIRRVSQYLGIKRSTLYAMIERKEIPHYRIGRLARFRLAEIDEWLLAKMCESQEKKTQRVCRRRLSPPTSASQIVRTASDEVNPGRYNGSGKSDRIKGLGKEG
ncbi:MAG: Helix-turn-helix domain protein [Syntrophorhabdaceae bacterium PtaU1.Bin034]|nr:MAG: Helix-turn-helix domain protein [Syntrophorhabdaceae bacterium PtaU1.Bin034]